MNLGAKIIFKLWNWYLVLPWKREDLIPVITTSENRQLKCQGLTDLFFVHVIKTNCFSILYPFQASTIWISLPTMLFSSSSPPESTYTWPCSAVWLRSLLSPISLQIVSSTLNLVHLCVPTSAPTHTVVFSSGRRYSIQPLPFFLSVQITFLDTKPLFPLSLDKTNF